MHAAQLLHFLKFPLHYHYPSYLVYYSDEDMHTTCCIKPIKPMSQESTHTRFTLINRLHSKRTKSAYIKYVYSSKNYNYVCLLCIS